MSSMLAVRHDLQVPTSVVIPDAVSMVNNFIWSEKASELPLDDQTMFGNPACGPIRMVFRMARGVGMVRSIEIDVSIGDMASLPGGMLIASRERSHVSSDERAWMPTEPSQSHCCMWSRLRRETAAAFTDPGWDLVCGGFISSHRANPITSLEGVLL